MSAIKDQIVDMIHHLPESSTFEDIQYHLYVLEKIKNAQEKIENGNGISNDEAKSQLKKWLTP